jgi:anti-sigma B factor antagonist
LEIAEFKDGEVTILAPKGSLNTQTSPKLEQKLVGVLGEKGRLIVIDFKGVDYLSSAALRVLLLITRRLAKVHGRLLLCAMSDDLKRVFAVSGFDRDFTILGGRGEAIAMAAATLPPPPAAEVEAKSAKAKPPKPAEPAPIAKPEPPQAPASLPPNPLVAHVTRLLATDLEAAPWASWPDAPTAHAKRESVVSLLARGL